MGQSFDVERVAIHLVDRALQAPRYALAEVDLGRFSGTDREAIDSFFDGHLNRAWQADEGERTRAAALEANSVVGKHFRRLEASRADFFDRSKALADHLDAVARKRNTTPGLLMVLWFRRHGDSRSFLGLFKMDPGASDLVTLRAGDGGQYLLDLAVEHVDQVLPPPETGVLKWAVLPHPTRPTFDAKLKDHEGDEDIALYFQDFLGCEPRLSPKRQVQVMVEELVAYAEAEHADENWQAAVADTLHDLKQKDRVDLPTVERSLTERSGLRGVDPAALRQRLRDRRSEDLDFPARTLRTAKLRYTLSNGIVIQGPIDVMESVVDVERDDGGWRFVLRAAEYDRDYV